jgi:hypothetical protein
LNNRGGELGGGIWTFLFFLFWIFFTDFLEDFGGRKQKDVREREWSYC